MSIDRAKQAAADAALEFVKEGMTIGLGSGSTATYFILRLGELCRKGLHIFAIASSSRSLELALQEKIPLIDSKSPFELDLVVDGADQIDPMRRMLKGGGGALLREKIIANMAKKMVVIVDSTKQVDVLGTFPLAVELLPFCHKATEQHLRNRGFRGKIRVNGDGENFITDNGNYIWDIVSEKNITDPRKLDEAIRAIPGTIETGLFYNLVSHVLIGQSDGTVKWEN